jgi:hypothetical protein
MQQARRNWGRVALAIAPLLGACYVYRPLVVPEPQAGTRLAFDLNDQGRAALITSVGPEVERVEGALLSNGTGEYVIRVSGVQELHGRRTKWSGETVTLREEYVQRIRERRLSRGRTAFAVAGLLGAMVGFVASTDLAGFGSGTGDDRPGGGPGDGQ